MNHKLFTTLSGLSVTSILLAVSIMTPGQATRPSVEFNDSPVTRAIGSDATTGTGPATTPSKRKPRRQRTSLSMPYFSFAQSLRPRG